MKKLALLLVAILAIPMATMAKEKSERVEEYTYKVSQRPSFNANTTYVDFVIIHWDKSDIGVRVVTKAEATTKEVANDLLNVIKVNFTNTGNGINVSNTFDNELNNRCQRKSRSKSMSVTCYISLPSNTSMNIVTKYGDYRIDKIMSPLVANLTYGDMTVSGEIASTSRFTVAYGDIKIEKTSGQCDINIRYGDVKVSNGNSINATAAYSDFKLGTICTFKANLKYSDVKAERVDNFGLSGANYGDYVIGTLTNSLEISGMTYSDLVVKSVSPNFTKISIPSSSYSDIKMSISGGSFNANLTTRYGDIKLYDESSEKSLSRTIGNNPNARVDISTTYGDIKITR